MRPRLGLPPDRIVVDPIEAKCLLDALARHGLGGAELRRHHLAPLAYVAGHGEFERDFIANALLAERRARVVAEVVAAFSAADIPVLLLKGISYAAWLYGDPALRPMADVDLMVQPARHRVAREVLARIGFDERVDRVSGSRFHHAVTLQRRGDMIDLHRNIAQPGRTSIDLRAVWHRSSSCLERSDDALRMELVDEALFHFVGVARTQLYAPAVSYVDGALMLARMNASQQAALNERARQYRVRRAVAAAMHMTRMLMDPARNESPRGLTARVLPGPREVLRYELPARATQLVRKLALLDGPRDAAAFLLVSAAERLPILRD